MMQDVRLDATGDLDLIGGDLVLTSGAADIAQQARVRLDIQRGTWALDVTAGLDWIGQILTRVSDEQIALLITQELLRVERIVQVRRVRVTRGAGRHIRVDAVCRIVEDERTIERTLALEVGDDGLLQLVLEPTGGF
jgi:hypothetical protein